MLKLLFWKNWSLPYLTGISHNLKGFPTTVSELIGILPAEPREQKAALFFPSIPGEASTLLENFYLRHSLARRLQTNLQRIISVRRLNFLCRGAEIAPLAGRAQDGAQQADGHGDRGSTAWSHHPAKISFPMHWPQQGIRTLTPTQPWAGIWSLPHLHFNT